MRLKKYYQATDLITNKTENTLEFDNGVSVQLTDTEYNHFLSKMKKPAKLKTSVSAADEDGVEEL
jgi:hypothetical protein